MSDGGASQAYLRIIIYRKQHAMARDPHMELQDAEMAVSEGPSRFGVQEDCGLSGIDRDSAPKGVHA